MPSILSGTLSTAIRNPSRQMTKRLISVALDGGVRGVIDPDNCDLLIWLATEATHKFVEQSINEGLIDQSALFRLNTSDQIDKIIVWP